MTSSNSSTSNILKSRKDAAIYLGIKAHTLAVWACTDRYDLPMVKIGRSVKYRQSDLDSFIERNIVGKVVFNDLKV